VSVRFPSSLHPWQLSRAVDGMPALRQLCVTIDAVKPPRAFTHPPFCQPLPSHFRQPQTLAQQLPFPASDTASLDGREVRNHGNVSCDG
jgi:hypothetical protein